LGRVAFIAFVVVSAVAIVVGVWSFRRDEYPFQFTPAEVVAARVEGLQESVFVGTLATPAPELAHWISSMERDLSDVPPDPIVRLVVELSDGRQMQLDVGWDASLGSWIAGPQTDEPAAHLDTETDLYWYLRGVCDGMR